MKISMVGSGRVGSTTLFNLLLEGAAQELVVVDILKERAEGEALDLLHGTALSHRCRIYSGDYDATEGSDVAIITAGIPRQPGETRLDLLKKNVGLMEGVLDQLMRYSQDLMDQVVEATRFGGAEVIKKKGGTFYSVAPMITELVRAIRLDQKRVIPVSTLQDGSHLGMKDACLSLPTIVGKNGPERVMLPRMNDQEREA